MFQGIPWFYKSFWLEQNRVAFLEIIGDLDDSGTMAFNRHMRAEYLAQSKTPIYCIIDTASLSGDSQTIQSFCKELEITFKHRNVGAVVLISTNQPIVNVFASKMAVTACVPFKQVSTLMEARDTLRQLKYAVAS